MERAPPGEMGGSSVPGEDAASSGAWHRHPDGGSRRHAWVKIARDIRVPNHYHALLELAGEIPETAAQIEKDLPRTGATFAKQGFQLRPGEPTWRALRNILTAYAAHDPETGYVQSMNFQAAFLVLAGLDEEDAFWCLVALVTKIVPGYFSEGMAAAKLDQRVFCRLVHHHLPAVGLHLETIAPDNIVPAIISAQWLLTLFVNVLPAGATMRVWDRVFETETRAPLFACALALLQPAAEAILNCDEMGETVETLQSLGSTFERDAKEKEDALIARLDAYLADAVAPARFLKEVSRERGRRASASDAFLPEAVKRAVPAVTEIDELVEGLRSDLGDVVGASALARRDAEAEAEAEEAERAAAEKAEKAEKGSDYDPDDADDAAWELTAGPKAVGAEWAEALLAAGSESSTRKLVAADAARAGRVFFPESSTPTTPMTPMTPMTSDSERGHGAAPLGIDALSLASVLSPRVSGRGGLAGTSPEPSPDPRMSSEIRDPRAREDPAAGSFADAFADAFAATEDHARRVDEALSAVSDLYPAYARAYADVARSVALAPARAFAEAFPGAMAKRAAFERRLDALREMSLSLATRHATEAAAAGDEDAGLAWRPGERTGASEGGLSPGGPAWTAWADSVFERVVRRADEALDFLRGVARALDRVAWETSTGGKHVREGTPGVSFSSVNAYASEETAHDTHEDPEKDPEKDPAEDPAEDPSEDPAEDPDGSGIAPGLASRVAACADAHAERVASASRACASAASRVSADAARDAPLLAANRARVTEDLRREARGAAAAIATWSAAAEARRRRKTKAALDAMRDAADAAAAAFENGGTAEDAPGSEASEASKHETPIPPISVSDVVAHDPASLAASFALEDARLERASRSLGAAATTVSRRQNAVARERAAAEAVRLHAEAQALQATRRASRLERVADACARSLEKRSDPCLSRSLLPALETAVAALGKASASFFREAAERDFLPWLDEAAANAALAYVAAVDAAAQKLDERVDLQAARVAESAAKERRKGEDQTILGGLLEDAADFIAPHGARQSFVDADADADTSAAKEVFSLQKEREPSGAAGVAQGPATQFPLLRDRSAKAFASLAFGVETGVAKLSGAFQGSAVGGAFAKTFGGRKEKEEKEEKERGDGGSENESNASFSPPSARARAEGTAASSRTSPSAVGSPRSDTTAAVPSSASPRGPPRESRALREARDDLRRLETRRDELLEKKRRLRALLVPEAPRVPEKAAT